MRRLSMPIREDDHVLGPANAPVTLVEYGDYQCPYCKRAHLGVAQALARVGAHVRFAYRHFPLTELHPFALLAAQAAEAASAQGAFWAMHDALFQNQEALDLGDLVTYGDALGLDVQRMRLDIEEGAYLARIASDVRSGYASGVQGTPTLFLDGAHFERGYDAQTLVSAIEARAHRVQHVAR